MIIMGPWPRPRSPFTTVINKYYCDTFTTNQSFLLFNSNSNTQNSHNNNCVQNSSCCLKIIQSTKNVHEFILRKENRRCILSKSLYEILNAI